MSLSERFWKKVKKTDTCWLWVGATSTGYGRLVCNGEVVGAHRISYLLNVGKIPTGIGFHGICVLHRCDNRKCVRPDHLFLGSQKDNISDMIQKNRGQRGERNGLSKLTEIKVKKIRDIYSKTNLSGRAIARKFQVNHETVRRILLGKAWKHV